MASGERASFKNPVIGWIDERLPLFSLMQKEYGTFPTPRNFNYFWNFGAIAMVMLVTMIVTGIVLAMHYTPHTDYAFGSVERIMRDVNWGWLLRYLHMNGASFFFIAVYIHMYRGMYYGSFKKPRELLWMLGVLIFLLMMATAFMGYVLPWGQMSFWGATVITGFFTAIPWVGDGIQTWLLGGFAVDNATLNRFFSLHYLFPFLIFGVVVLHVWALHISGSNNPTGIEPKTDKDTLPFHPYYTAKDTFGLLVFLVIYAAVTFYAPNMLGHPDNYIEANPMVTPAHIVPEWYFLPFYAILRAITFGVNPYVLISLGLIVLAMLPYYSDKKAEDINCKRSMWLFIAGGFFFMLGYLSQLETAGGGTFINLPLDSTIFVTAKLGGVLAMFGSIAVLFVLPWLDTSPVRSARYRPNYKKALWLFVVFFLVLGVVGANPAEGFWVILGQLGTAYYLGFFLIILPLLNKYEKTLPTPKSINEAVLAEEA
jgi:ubiquinol-cytochrome c reductase cytochrome b subunit